MAADLTAFVCVVQAAGLQEATEDLTDTETESGESSGAEDQEAAATGTERRGDSSATVRHLYRRCQTDVRA